MEKLYHATFETYYESIMTLGLGAVMPRKNWCFSKDGVVYLAIDGYVAESYAENAEDEEEWDEDLGGPYVDVDLGKIIVLEIDVFILDQNLLKPDENIRDNDGSSFEYAGIIPPHAIRIWDRK